MEALPIFRISVHRSGRRLDRVCGRFVPSRLRAVPAEAGTGGRGALPARRLPKQPPSTAEAVRGWPGRTLGACRSRSVGSDGWFGACRSRSVPSVRGSVADRSRQRVTRGTIGPTAEAACFIGTGGFHLPKQVEVPPTAAGEDELNHRPTSQAEAGSRSTEVETEPEDRFPGSRRGSDPPKRTPTSPRGTGNREVLGEPAEAGASVPSRAPEFVASFRGPRFQVPGSDALRGSGRLRGLSPLTSPLRCPAVSSGPPLVSPMGLCPLRGPLSSAAVPRLPGAEASGFRCSPALPKQGGVPGKVLRTGHPVRWASVRSPQRVARGFRSIPSWVARDAPSRDCSLSWFRRAAPEVCPGARVASRTSVGAASHCWMVFRRRCLAGLHGVFDVKDLKCRQAAF